jgi:hypothetical protein
VRSLVIAPLLALGLVVATAGPAAAFETTITGGPAQDARILPGDVTFTFETGEGGSSYECQLNDAGAYVACNSGTITYPGLTPGAYVFRVKGTVAGQGTDPTPAERNFIVRNVPCEQASAAWTAARNDFFKYKTKKGYKKEALQRAKDAGKVKKVQRLKKKIKALNKLIRKARNAMEAAEAKQDQVC